jgi:hypothetical protein
MTVFADDFALIAWVNPADDAHARVTAYLDGFTGRLVATEWVLMEVADALSAPAARSKAQAVAHAVWAGKDHATFIGRNELASLARSRDP